MKCRGEVLGLAELIVAAHQSEGKWADLKNQVVCQVVAAMPADVPAVVVVGANLHLVLVRPDFCLEARRLDRSLANCTDHDLGTMLVWAKLTMDGNRKDV